MQPMSDSYPQYCDGQVRGGVVVLAEGMHLPEGTRVTVIPLHVADEIPEIDSIYDMAKLAVPSGIPDLSRNIDHYLYGHPKVSDAQP
jgi:hypothetical protein